MDIVILPSGKLKDKKWFDIRSDFEKLLNSIEERTKNKINE